MASKSQADHRSQVVPKTLLSSSFSKNLLRSTACCQMFKKALSTLPTVYLVHANLCMSDYEDQTRQT